MCTVVKLLHGGQFFLEVHVVAADSRHCPFIEIVDVRGNKSWVVREDSVNFSFVCSHEPTSRCQTPAEVVTLILYVGCQATSNAVIFN